MTANKKFFNIFEDAKKNGGFFVSHQTNGAKGSAAKGLSKTGNAILLFDVQVEGLHLKGVFNKTDPAKARPGSPTIWANVDDAGKSYRLAGWWTTVKKSGEPVKAPYFSCSVQEDVAAEPAEVPTQHEPDFSDVPF